MIQGKKKALRSTGSNPCQTPAPRRLTRKDINAVIEILRRWSAPSLTWEALQAAVARDILGVDRSNPMGGWKGWSRQALSKHTEIVVQYQSCQQAIHSKSSPSKRPRQSIELDPQVAVLINERDALVAELARLQKILAGYEERFVRALYNRTDGALTPNQLQAQIRPKIDRLNRG